MKLERLDFMSFLIMFLAVTVTSFVLTLNSNDPAVFVGFFSFAIGALVLCTVMYMYPVIRESLSPEHQIRVDPGDVLLKGVNGEHIRAHKRTLEDMIRRTEI